MIRRLVLVLLVVVCVGANPAANGPWHWIHRRLSVSPNLCAAPCTDIVKEVFRPRPKYTTGTVKIENCGQAPLASKTIPAIVGGNEVSPHSYPWQVALFIDDMYFCGGSIISDEWVMTAAHCMEKAGFVDVVAGAHDITISEPSQVTLRSTDSFIHEEWDSGHACNDIAMIRLPEKLTFNDYIQPVCLPTATEDDLLAGVIVTPTGWGKTHDGPGGTSDVLRGVDEPILSNSDCAETFGTYITENVICIDGSSGRGTCNGDSGGPMNYKTGSVTETRGIVSFGAAAGCQVGYPDVFTRVSHYLDWIQVHTGVAR